MTTLLREIATYNSKLPELLANDGKYVLIKGDEVIDFYDTYADALKIAYEKFDDGEFFVKRISPAESVSFFTRDLVSACQASQSN